METGVPIHVLMVEDNPDDVLLTRHAFQEAKILNSIHVARDGKEALEYLRREGKYADPAKAPRPGLVILDLNLPKVGGLDVLRQMKSDASLAEIPVIILTVSNEDEDILRGYDLGIKAFIQKPVVLRNLIDYFIEDERFSFLVVDSGQK